MIHEARGLAAPELDAIADLERRVVAADGGRLKLEWGNLRRRSPSEVSDLLWVENGRTLGFAGLYAFGGPLELAGMVDPETRRRGIGTALLGRALQLAAERGIGEALLVVARTTPAGAAFARRHGGELEHSEHSLVLREAPSCQRVLPGVTLRPATREDAGRVSSLLRDGFGDDSETPQSADPSERGLLVEHDRTVVGTLRVNVDADDRGLRAGIYGFVVDPARRGRGIGREVLRQVCAGLLEEGCIEVSLEVAVENEHALGLYTSVGFVRRATEDYYAISTAPGADPGRSG